MEYLPIYAMLSAVCSMMCVSASCARSRYERAPALSRHAEDMAVTARIACTGFHQGAESHEPLLEGHRQLR
jgi:hypothetical protein